MPIFEYDCRDCRGKTTALVMRRDQEVRCAKCGGANLTKLFSRFATPKSEEARLESLADPSSMGDIDENDPKSVARWMTRMGSELGEDLGDDIDQAGEDEVGGKDGSNDAD
jgi:putative FmdB family regulatory protein